MTDEPMTLFRALQILAATHTRDDDVTGFVVEMGASPQNPASWGGLSSDPNEYFRAWSEVRRQVNLSIEPWKIPF